MDGATVERCVEQLARELCQSGTVAQSTKKRMLANLAKDDKNASLQVRDRSNTKKRAFKDVCWPETHANVTFACFLRSLVPACTRWQS